MNKLTAQDILIAVNIFDNSFRVHGHLFQSTAAQVEFRTRDGEEAGYYWNRETGFKGFITRTDFDGLDDSGAFDGLVDGRDWDYAPVSRTAGVIRPTGSTRRWLIVESGSTSRLSAPETCAKCGQSDRRFSRRSGAVLLVAAPWSPRGSAGFCFPPSRLLY